MFSRRLDHFPISSESIRDKERRTGVEIPAGAVYVDQCAVTRHDVAVFILVGEGMPLARSRNPRPCREASVGAGEVHADGMVGIALNHAIRKIGQTVF